MTPYSVSPICLLHTVGPKPMNHWGTLQPNFFAGHEVPELVQPDRGEDREDEGDDTQRCRAGRTCAWGPSRASVTSSVMRAAASARAQESAARTSSTVRCSFDGTSWRSRTCATVETMSGKRIRPSWKASTRDLVGGVVDGGRGAAALPRRPGEGDGGEDLVVEGLEAPVRGRVQSIGVSASGTRSGQPIPREIGTSMVGRPSCDHRAVDELHHRVDELLRVDDDVDAVEGDVEEQVRLDDLEALVDQRRGVGGDHPPHREVGVRERLLRGDVGELLGRATAERAPGRGEDEASYLLGGAGTQALGDGTVLGVDRHDLARLARAPSPAGRR